MDPVSLDFDSAIATNALLEEEEKRKEAEGGEPGVREIDAEDLTSSGTVSF